MLGTFLNNYSLMLIELKVGGDDGDSYEYHTFCNLPTAAGCGSNPNHPLGLREIETLAGEWLKERGRFVLNGPYYTDINNSSDDSMVTLNVGRRIHNVVSRFARIITRYEGVEFGVTSFIAVVDSYEIVEDSWEREVTVLYEDGVFHVRGKEHIVVSETLIGVGSILSQVILGSISMSSIEKEKKSIDVRPLKFPSTEYVKSSSSDHSLLFRFGEGEVSVYGDFTSFPGMNGMVSVSPLATLNYEGNIIDHVEKLDKIATIAMREMVERALSGFGPVSIRINGRTTHLLRGDGLCRIYNRDDKGRDEVLLTYPIKWEGSKGFRMSVINCILKLFKPHIQDACKDMCGRDSRADI